MVQSVQVARGEEEVAQLVLGIIDGERTEQVEGSSVLIDEGVPHGRSVDRSARAQRLERGLPPLPAVERAPNDTGALGADGAVGREQLVHEVGEHRLGQLDERLRTGVAVDDLHAVARDPGERGAVVDAEHEGGAPRRSSTTRWPCSSTSRGRSRASGIQRTRGAGTRARSPRSREACCRTCRCPLPFQSVRPSDRRVARQRRGEVGVRDDARAARRRRGDGVDRRHRGEDHAEHHEVGERRGLEVGRREDVDAWCVIVGRPSIWIR